MRVQLQPAFVLHTRAYGDTSIIADILARDYGRLSLLVKGQRAAKGRSRKPITPFAELVVSWQGSGELKLLTHAELVGAASALAGDGLYCALYVNELLVRLLPPQDPHPEIFADYRQLLRDLYDGVDLEPRLRQFELCLLDQLGYGISFYNDADSGAVIAADGLYRFVPDVGFIAVDATPNSNRQVVFNGSTLLAVAANDYSAAETRRQAKRLTRLALLPHLGDKPLKSRELFSKR